jgi:hypothetical protein
MALDPEVFITLTRARLAESARGSIARDDVAAQGTQADNNRPREPAILNFEPIKNLAVSQRSGPALPRGGPSTAPSPPLNSHNGGAVLLILYRVPRLARAIDPDQRPPATMRVGCPKKKGVHFVQKEERQ